MSDERAKFIKHLKQTMKKSGSAVERLEARKLYAKLVLGEGASAGDISLDENGNILETGAPVQRGTPDIERAPDMSEYAQEARRAVSQPRSELNCILGLIQPARWMKGLWGNIADGWHDNRSGTDLTFDEARVWIADRIAELGLDPAKVYGHPKSNSSIAEFTAFINAPFKEQMENFK